MTALRRTIIDLNKNKKQKWKGDSHVQIWERGKWCNNKKYGEKGNHYTRNNATPGIIFISIKLIADGEVSVIFELLGGRERWKC